jgi:REP element-mobilizing transposase RayT
MKAVAGLPSFRRESIRKALCQTVWAAQREVEFRILHFSVQPNHLHLIVEAEEGVALSRGVQGFAVRVAKSVNRRLSRRGKLWRHRYFARDLRTARQVRTALVYVLQNHKKSLRGQMAMDLYSSAALFDGWEVSRETDFLRWGALEMTGLGAGPPWRAMRDARADARAGRGGGRGAGRDARGGRDAVGEAASWPVVAPLTWLAREGWMKAGGPIGLGEHPKRRSSTREERA